MWKRPNRSLERCNSGTVIVQQCILYQSCLWLKCYMQIAAAYEALADNEKRKLYDQVGAYIHAHTMLGRLAGDNLPWSECLSEGLTAKQ